MLNLLISLSKNHNFDESLVDSKEFDKMNKYFTGNIKELREEADNIQEISQLNNSKLKKIFTETTEAILKKEKNQFNQLDKCFKNLNREYQAITVKMDELHKEKTEIKKELENSTLKNKEIASEIKYLKEDKTSFIRIIKEIQRKLLNYIDYLGSLDIDLEANGSNSNTKLPGRMSISFEAADQSKYDINVMNNGIQNNFDIMILKANEIHKNYVKFREEVRQNNECKKINLIEKDNLNKKFNEIWNLYNESLKEKEKLYNQIEYANQNFKVSSNENTVMKNDFKNLENKIQQSRNEINNKDKEIENMIAYSKKIKNDMENQIELIRKEANDSEMKKLSILEDKYMNQIQRYENKILEDEKSMKEIDDLMKNYQSKIDNKTVEDELSRKNMNQILNNYEKTVEDWKIKSNKQLVEIEELTKSNKNFSKIIQELEEKLKTKDMNFTKDYLLSFKKKESENQELTVENQELTVLNQSLKKSIDELEDKIRCKEEENDSTIKEYIQILQIKESENRELTICNQILNKEIQELKDRSKIQEEHIAATRDDQIFTEFKSITKSVRQAGDPLLEYEIKKYQEQFKEMQAMIDTYNMELQRLEQENLTFHQKIIKYQENEEQYRIKLSKLQ